MKILKFLMGQILLRDEFDPAKDGGDPVKVTAYHKAQTEKNAALMKEIDDLKKANTVPPAKKDDPSLADKARLERETNEKKTKYERSLESALNFTIASPTFLKDNVGLLPKTVEGIFVAAEKEKYDSAVDKSNAIKVGVVSEFFAVQANHDLLTGAQKVELEDFLKLTKNGKTERVENVYAMIFEPTLETLRKVEKAKQVSSGSKDQSTAEKQLADKMMKASKKHYLGDKE